MKLENFSNLYFVLSVLMPGFVYSGVIGNFVPTRAHKEKEVLLLRYLTATAFNYAFCSPLIYLLIFDIIFQRQPLKQAACWFFIIFIAPVILAVVRAALVQHDGMRWFYRFIRLRTINPIPTGWDWIFSTTQPCFVLITLRDGTEIAGYFGERSMASSDPDRKDIFVERVYTVPEDGGPWQEVERTLGTYVDGSQIAFIEFRG